MPGPVSSPGANVFIADERRNWLTDGEGDQLQKLYDAYHRNEIIHPVSTALWYHDYCSWLYYIDVRWTLISIALDSLVHTDSYRSTKQFAKRVPRLANEVNMAITEQEATQFYELRSGLVHGGLGEMSADNQHLYRLMEELLRRVIKRAIIEPQFSAFLADHDLIRNTWSLD
ncbi:MAG: hypothetical protein PHT78_08345 [Desulfitobacteriaceae bacterium]|nr:hypothetical protein [Desulfitobacteriaceae bacterium]